MARTDKSDPVARCLELSDEIIKRTGVMRDFATSPGNIWLARNELAKIGQLISELESLFDQIKRTENK